MAAVLPRGFARATANDVREWAADNDLPAGGSRGRLPGDTIEAFNAAHSKGKGRRKYIEGAGVGLMTITEYGPKGGVLRTVTADPNTVRAAAALAGVEVSARGRISQAAKDAYLASV